jgi:hypothetical protein
MMNFSRSSGIIIKRNSNQRWTILPKATCSSHWKHDSKRVRCCSVRKQTNVSSLQYISLIRRHVTGQMQFQFILFLHYFALPRHLFGSHRHRIRLLLGLDGDSEFTHRLGELAPPLSGKALFTSDSLLLDSWQRALNLLLGWRSWEVQVLGLSDGVFQNCSQVVRHRLIMPLPGILTFWGHLVSERHLLEERRLAGHL